MSQTDPGVDPASAAALVALLSQGGPWAVVVVVIGLVLRAWRDGSFISKSVHDQIVVVIKERYADVVDRLKASQEAIEKWREASERAATAAAQAQERLKEVLERLDTALIDLGALKEQMDRFRTDFHDARVWRELGQDDDRPRDPRQRESPPWRRDSPPGG